MNHSTRPMTKYEAERVEALSKLGCSACAVLGVPNLNYLELHHILDGGIRMGHWFTIFLCRGHHQGDWNESQFEWIDAPQRCAISDGRKRFSAVYGTERSLWERAQDRLKLPKVWPPTKILPRRGYAASQALVVDAQGDVGMAQVLARGSSGSDPAGGGAR